MSYWTPQARLDAQRSRWQHGIRVSKWLVELGQNPVEADAPHMPFAYEKQVARYEELLATSEEIPAGEEAAWLELVYAGLTGAQALKALRLACGEEQA